MLKPASAIPMTQMRSSLEGFRDSIYPNFIKSLAHAGVFFQVILLTCFNLDYFQ